MKNLFFLVLLVISFGSFSQNPTLTVTGSLNTARYIHESQMLPDGKIIAFGGDNGDVNSHQIFSSAEIFDPATNRWTFTSRMIKARSEFTSVMLPNGNIMAIGGIDDNFNTLASCEIYNASTGTWAYADSMKTAREYPEAILLKNGKVLVVGGSYVSNTHTELYDPATNTWSYTGDVNILRGGGVSLVMLKDGRILLTGGSNTTAANTAEIYDPTLQIWTKVSANMVRPRAYHTSVLLNDGRVLIVGSGNANFTDQITPEIFNPATNTFTAATFLLTNVGRSEMVVMDDGRVLVYGIGDISALNNSKILQVYNPVNNQWTTDVYAGFGANAYTMHRLTNGKVLIVGGNWTTGNGATSQCMLVTQPGYTSCVPANTLLKVTGQSICSGKDATLVLTGSEADASYQPYIGNYSVGAVVNGGGNLSLTIPYSNLNQGSNMIKILVRKSGCTYTALKDTAIVNVYNASGTSPVITSSGSLNFCPGSNVTLTSSSGSGYLWSDGSTGQSITVSQTGIYSVKVLDASGCAGPSSDQVKTLLYGNTVTAGVNESICQNAPVLTLSGNSPPGGTWSGTGVSSDGIYNPVSVSPGTYTLTYTQCAKSATKTITVMAGPVLNNFTVRSLADSICIGSNTSIVVESTTSGAYYQLKVGSTNVGTAISSNGNPVYLSTGARSVTTTFTVSATYSNSCGNLNLTKDITIKVLPNPVAHVVVVKDTICLPESTVFKIANSNPRFSYKVTNYNYPGSFFNGNGDTLTIIGPPAYPDGSGNWLTYQVVATNAMSCSTVTVFSKKIVGYTHFAEFGVQQGYFLNEQVQLVNNSTGDQYQWSLGNTATITSSSLKTPPSFNYTSTGPKSIRLISTSRFGCVDTITKGLNVYNAAPLSSGKACFLDTVSSRPKQEEYPDEAKYSIVDLHVDSNNNSYVAGFTHIAYFGGDYSGSFSMYLKKLGPAGNLLWETKQSVFDYADRNKYYSTFISAVTTDTQGNVYITGSYANTELRIGTVSSSSRPSTYVESFIVKLNSAGSAQWIIHGINQSETYDAGGTDILHVDDDHIYVSLFRPNLMRFPDGSIQDFDHELIILQIDKDGKFKKYFHSENIQDYLPANFSTYNPDYEYLSLRRLIPVSPKMKLSSDGKIFLAGKSTRTLTYGTFTILPDTEGVVYYMAILDTADGWQNAFPLYVRYEPVDYYEVAAQLPQFTLDQNNNIYVTNFYSNRYYNSYKAGIKLGGNVILGDTSGSFIAKYDPTGNLLWYNSNAISFPKGIEYLQGTNQLITYGVYDNNYFGQTSQTLLPMAIKSKGDIDAYLASTSPSGDLNWIEPIGSKGMELGYAMTSNSCNDVVLLGKLDQRGGIKSDSLYYPGGKLYLSRFSPTASCATACNTTSSLLKVNVYSSKEYRSNIAPIPLYIKFNRSVTGFDISDLVVTNATLSGFTGSGDTYSVLLTPVSVGSTISASVPANAATDGSVTNKASNFFSIIYDNISPNLSLSSTSPAYFRTATISLAITATEGLIGLTATDLQLVNCKVTGFSGSGKSYSATITPIAEGNISIQIPAASAVDSAGNPNSISNLFAGVYDITRPSGTVTSNVIFPTPISPIPVTITFTEPILNFTTGHITFSPSTGATIANFQNPSGDLKTYTADIVVTATNNYWMYVDAYLTDLAGNYSSQIAFNFKFDISKPTVTLSSTTTAITGVNPIPVTVSFSKRILGLTPGSFVISNGTVASLTGSGSSYILTITPTLDGTVTVQLPAGVVADTVGNTNTASTVLSRTFDSQKPMLTIFSSASNPTRNSPIPLTLSWSENVTGFTSADFTITNGSVTSFSGSGMNYTASITPTGSGVVTVKVNADMVTDAGLNGNLASGTFIINYDIIRPTVTFTTSAANPTTESLIHVDIVFSENVIGFVQSDLFANNVTISNFTGSGSVYSVDLSPQSVGFFSITLSAGMVSDNALNTNLATSYTNTFQTIDTTPPGLTIGSSAGDTVNLSSIPLTFTFTEPVTGFTSADIIVSNGTITGFSGSGSDYYASVIPSSQGLVSVKVNANSAQDAALNPNDASNELILLYDNINPVVTITSSSSDPTSDNVIPLTINFSEPVIGFTLSDFTTINGSISNLMGSGTTYTADLSPGTIGLVQVSLNASVISDQAGNGNSAASFSITYAGADNIRPSLTISSTETSPSKLTTIPLLFTFSEAVSGFTLSDISVSNGTLSAFAGNGANYSASVSPASDGIVVVSVASDMALDLASNGNDAASFTINFDSSLPTVTMSSAETDTTSASSFILTITFSEPVTDFTLSDLTISNGTLSNLQGSGAVYTVAVSPSIDGVVSVSLITGGIFDLAGNESGGASFTIVYDDPLTAITVTDLKQMIRLYPNPSNGIITLEHTSSWEGAEISISNMMGAIVYKGSATEPSRKYVIDISFLKGGAYNLQISQNNKILNQLIILQE